MSKTITDSRQIEHRGSLPRVTDLSYPTLKQALPLINSELTPIFELRESSTPDLVLNIGAGKLQNSDTELSRAFSPIKKKYFSFTSGTITFPASSGGTITVSPGVNSTLTLSSGNFIVCLIQINYLGQMSVILGTEAASAALAESAANFPKHKSGLLPVGYIVLQNVAGVIQNIQNSAIVQFAAGGGGGGGADLDGEMTIANNQVAPADITDFILDPLDGENVKVDYSVVRKHLGNSEWVLYPAASSQSWQSSAYGNGVFIVAGNFTGNIMRSIDDGVTWSLAATPESNFWTSMAYGNGVFVAVSQDGTNRVMRSIDDGLTWSAIAASEANQWYSVTYGNGVFVAVSRDGTNRVMRSIDDGLTWSPIAAAEANTWNSITYGNGVFVAVAENGTNKSMRSIDDGLTWSPIFAPSQQWNSITYGNGVFIATNNNTSIYVMVSVNDGLSWTYETTGISQSWKSIAYGNGRFVAVSTSGTQSMYSTSNGLSGSWIGLNSLESNQWTTVSYGNGYFVAASQTGTTRTMRLEIDLPTYLREAGSFYIQYDDDTTDWTVTGETFAGQDAEVEFSVSGNQVQYTSSNIAGTIVKSIMNFFAKYL